MARMEIRAGVKCGKAEGVALAKIGIVVEQHQRHLHRAALADGNVVPRRQRLYIAGELALQKCLCVRPVESKQTR